MSNAKEINHERVQVVQELLYYHYNARSKDGQQLMDSDGFFAALAIINPTYAEIEKAVEIDATDDAGHYYWFMMLERVPTKYRQVWAEVGDAVAGMYIQAGMHSIAKMRGADFANKFLYGDVYDTNKGIKSPEVVWEDLELDINGDLVPAAKDVDEVDNFDAKQVPAWMGEMDWDSMTLHWRVEGSVVQESETSYYTSNAEIKDGDRVAFYDMRINAWVMGDIYAADNHYRFVADNPYDIDAPVNYQNILKLGGS